MIRIRNQGLLWAILLLLAGAFLLLKNLDVFGQWGDVAWGGLFVVAGLGFLAWFVLNIQQWWRAIPGFILLSIGALVLLEWQKISLGEWRSSLVLFGIALGFWTVLLVRSENWWAAIPAGVLTLIGVLDGLKLSSNDPAWLAIFFAGLGLVFGLIYLLPRRDTRWAAVPAAGLILVAVTTFTSAANNMQMVVRWWPVLLLAAGLGLLIGSLQRPATGAKIGTAQEAATTPTGSASGGTQTVTPGYNSEPAPRPAIPLAGPAASEAEDEGPAEDKPADIYEFLAQQPPDTSARRIGYSARTAALEAPSAPNAADE